MDGDYRIWAVEWRPGGKVQFFVLEDEGQAKALVDDMKSKGHRATYWEVTR